MSFTTASHHCITELLFVGADDIRNDVTFRSASYSQPGGFHTTIVNVLTGETNCSCHGANKGEGCWHRTLAMAAFHALPAYQEADALTGDRLVTVGTKAARMVRVYRRRIWRVLPADQVTLVCCRAVFHLRRVAERAERDGVAA